MDKQIDPAEMLESLPEGMYIPPQPVLLKELHVEVNKVDVDIQKINNLISHDVALSAAVLKMVNSAYWGLTTKVESISHAVSLLGLEPTINLASGFMLRQAFDNKGISFPRYWDTAAMVAELCAIIASKLRIMDPNRPYTLGLFHDVGIPLMAQRYPDYMETLRAENVDEQGMFTDIEDARYQTNHAVVGCIVGHEWEIPSTIREVILNHHDIESVLEDTFNQDEEQAQLLCILKLAEMIEDTFRNGTPDTDWLRFGELIKSYLKISDDDIEKLIEEIRGRNNL